MFIEQEGMDDSLALPGLQPYRCRYRADRFETALFSQYRIGEPAGLHGWVRKRQAEFLAGRYCAARALGQHGLAHAQIAIGAHRAPVWPLGWAGSITHTHEHAMAVVAQGVDGIGIDLETILDARQAAEFAPTIVGAAELALGRMAGLDHAAFVSLCFSLKESIFKALYPHVGHYFGFEAVELVSVELAAGSWNARVSAPLSARFAPGFPISGRFALEQTTVLTGVVLAPHLQDEND